MSEEEATSALNRINVLAGMEADTGNPLPWKLSFSYGRALQQSCLRMWAGKDENIASAQALFQLRARCNSLATLGLYHPSEERITETQEGAEQERDERQRSDSEKPSSEGGEELPEEPLGDTFDDVPRRGLVFGLEEEEVREECKDLLKEQQQQQQQQSGQWLEGEEEGGGSGRGLTAEQQQKEREKRTYEQEMRMPNANTDDGEPLLVHRQTQP
jgi:hypothetical protein